jgi:hypothetical protein
LPWLVGEVLDCVGRREDVRVIEVGLEDEPAGVAVCIDRPVDAVGGGEQVAEADEGASTPTVNIAHFSHGTPWVGIVIEIVTSVGWEHSIDFGFI